MAGRTPGGWLALLTGGGVEAGAQEGNLVNLAFFLVLIVASLLLLGQRKFDWVEFARRNKALLALYAFYAVSSAWAPFAGVTIRRLIKDFSCVLIALVLLSEGDPLRTIRILFVRVAYLLFPLSLVLAKYFPKYGRTTSNHGEVMLSGVTSHKNELGQMVFIFGFMILFDLIELRREASPGGVKIHRWIRFGMLGLGVWLLKLSHCATAVACIVGGSLLLVGGSWLPRLRRPKRVLAMSFAVLVSAVLLNDTLGLSNMVVEALGRNANLTGRSEIWAAVKAQPTNPVIGCGFYSFWDSDFGAAVISQIAKIQEAHNGYLETYLDGGFIGVGLLVVLLLSTGKTSINRLLGGTFHGNLMFMFWAIVLVFNNAESNFFRLSTLWFTWLLVTVDYPVRVSKPQEASALAEGGEAEADGLSELPHPHAASAGRVAFGSGPGLAR